MRYIRGFNENTTDLSKYIVSESDYFKKFNTSDLLEFNPRDKFRINNIFNKSTLNIEWESLKFFTNKSNINYESGSSEFYKYLRDFKKTVNTMTIIKNNDDYYGITVSTATDGGSRISNRFICDQIEEVEEVLQSYINWYLRNDNKSFLNK